MSDKPSPSLYPFELPALSYDYGALEPYFDEHTMRLHHDKHHRAYVDNLNAALKDQPQFHGKGLDTILDHLDELPASMRDTVRNNGGGHVNHELLWKVIGPTGTTPQADLLSAIRSDFDSLENFKARFSEAAVKHFASGWAFLGVDPVSGRLEIATVPNHDTLMSTGKRPLLICDVWEHAYYLKYQNRRAEFLQAFWQVVDWNAVNERLLMQRRATESDLLRA